MVCKLCLKDDIVGLFLRLSSRLFQILIADGILDLVETFVRVKGVEKLLSFLRSTPKFHLLVEELSQQYMLEPFHY